MTTQETIELFKKYVIANYKRLPKVIVKGQGCYLYDADGNRILDMFPAVKKVFGNIMRGSYINDKGEKVPYVKPSPRAVLNLSINKQ